MPVCRPGETIAGVVVLKLSSPMDASHLQLKFCGVERVRRTPVATARMEIAEKRQQLTMMSQTMVMDKEFFRRELVLWGTPRVGSARTIPCDRAHRFHFSFTMPHVNMPTPRQTPDIEISYYLEASLFTEVLASQRGERVLKDVHKTGAKCFRFEPVVQSPMVSHALSAAPLETVVAMVDATAAAAAAAASATGGIASSQPLGSNAGDLRPASLLPFQLSGSSAPKLFLNLHVFNSTPAYLPGETVELLILAPAGKKIAHATVQLRENIRCRKSSAPIIDESEVPILWRCSVDLTAPQEIEFSKLTKSSLTQDIGLVGRYLFTNSTSGSKSRPDNAVGLQLHQEQRQPKQQHQQYSGFSRIVGRSSKASIGAQSIEVSRNSTDAVPSSLVATAGLAIVDASILATKQQQQQLSNRLLSPSCVPLSPLTESQELLGSTKSIKVSNASCDTLGNTRVGMSESTTSLDSTTQSDTTAAAAAAVLPLSNTQQNPDNSAIETVSAISTPYLPPATTQQQQQQLLQKAGSTILSPLTSKGSSVNYGGGIGSNNGHRLSRNMSSENEDSISDRSSISDTISSRYQPSKTTVSPVTGNNSYLSLARANSTYNPLLQSKCTNRLSSVTPVALGGLLAKGSYRFAKVQFTLPPMAEMSPVSSVYLDYEYTVDIAMTLGGSFGTTKKATGRLPLKIVTSRRQTNSAGGGGATALSKSYKRISNGATKVGRDSIGGNSSSSSGSSSSQMLNDSVNNNSAQSLRDSISCLNLSIAQSEETSANRNSHNGLSNNNDNNGSPANTLSEFQFDTTLHKNGKSSICGGVRVDDDDGNFPCLLSFIQNGEKIPAPVLESINIGSNRM
ncbi:hypothetical protein GGI11_004116 [Coemansia sp. RSA 2049]|nr:hypothetical protein GGI11_004116 [Coemansia sp. RSA 2049]